MWRIYNKNDKFSYESKCILVVLCTQLIQTNSLRRVKKKDMQDEEYVVCWVFLVLNRMDCGKIQILVKT